MEDISSTPSKSNPSFTAAPSSSTATMNSSTSVHSDSTQFKSETETMDHPKSAESKPAYPSADGKIPENLENQVEEMAISEEEEEEGECGFCLFMKGGGCKDAFIEWEKCVEEGERNKEDIVEKCFQATAALKKCMEAHSDYYEPLLQAEKAAEEEAVKHLEEEKERLNNQEKGSEELGKKKESS